MFYLLGGGLPWRMLQPGLFSASFYRAEVVLPLAGQRFVAFDQPSAGHVGARAGGS
jgi:hypothetical protein